MCEVMVYRRIKTQKMPTVCHTFTLSPKAGLLSVADFQFHFKISPIVTSPLATGRLISLSIMSFKKFFWQIIFLLSMINLVVLISLPQCCLCPQIFAEHCQVTLQSLLGASLSHFQPFHTQQVSSSSPLYHLSCSSCQLVSLTSLFTLFY